MKVFPSPTFGKLSPLLMVRSRSNGSAVDASAHRHSAPKLQPNLSLN